MWAFENLRTHAQRLTYSHKATHPSPSNPIKDFLHLVTKNSKHHTSHGCLCTKDHRTRLQTFLWYFYSWTRIEVVSALKLLFWSLFWGLFFKRLRLSFVLLQCLSPKVTCCWQSGSRHPVHIRWQFTALQLKGRREKATRTWWFTVGVVSFEGQDGQREPLPSVLGF